MIDLTKDAVHNDMNDSNEEKHRGIKLNLQLFAEEPPAAEPPAAEPPASEPPATEPPAPPAPGTIAGGQPKEPDKEPAKEPDKEPPAQVAPEKYDFTESLKGMALDEEEANAFSELAREMNLTNEQANKMASYGFDFASKVLGAVEAQRNTEIAGWGEAAKQTLGADFDKTVQLCGVGVEAMEKTLPGIREALNITGAGNRVEIIQAFAELGKYLQQDPGKGVDGQHMGADKSDPASRYPNTQWDRYKS